MFANGLRNISLLDFFKLIVLEVSKHFAQFLEKYDLCHHQSSVTYSKRDKIFFDLLA